MYRAAVTEIYERARKVIRIRLSEELLRGLVKETINSIEKGGKDVSWIKVHIRKMLDE